MQRRNGLGIALVVVDVVAWAVFGYTLLRIITTAFSIQDCIGTNDCAERGNRVAEFVPWLIGSAFAASILLTLAIFAFRMRSASSGPSSWDDIPTSGAMWNAAGQAAPPAWGASTSGPAGFPLPQPVLSPPAATPIDTQASVVRVQTIGSAPGGASVVQVELDVPVPGQGPRRILQQATLPAAATARLYPGAVVPIRVDPLNPANVQLDVGSF